MSDLLRRFESRCHTSASRRPRRHQTAQRHAIEARPHADPIRSNSMTSDISTPRRSTRSPRRDGARQQKNDRRRRLQSSGWFRGTAIDSPRYREPASRHHQRRQERASGVRSGAVAAPRDMMAHHRNRLPRSQGSGGKHSRRLRSRRWFLTTRTRIPMMRPSCLRETAAPSCDARPIPAACSFGTILRSTFLPWRSH